MGSGTGLQPPPDNSFERRADRARASTPRANRRRRASRRRRSAAMSARAPFGIGPPNCARRWATTAIRPRPLTGERRRGRARCRSATRSPTFPSRGARSASTGLAAAGDLGVAASMQALEKLLREGRPKFARTHLDAAPAAAAGEVRRRRAARAQVASSSRRATSRPRSRNWSRAPKRNERTQVLLGVTGSGKTFTMAKVIEATQRPALVLAPNKTLAAQLYGEFKSFFPDNAVEYFVSLLRLLPAGSLYPAHRHLHREGFLDQRADRPHAPFGDARAARARRRHHRRLGVLHLRHRLGRDLFGDDLLAQAGRAHRAAPADRRPGGAAIQAHRRRFRARHLPGARRHHRHFPGALRGPRLAGQAVRRRGRDRSTSSIRSPARRPTNWSSSRSTPTRTTSRRARR